VGHTGYPPAVPTLLSVNVGRPTPTTASRVDVTGIDKRPVAGPVEVRNPGSTRLGGLSGDAICDTLSHGGREQAVYAYAREDLDWWEAELGRPLPSGTFGENLTTHGLDVTGARIGERWRVGERCVLEVGSPRIPCRTFAAWLREAGWEKRFTRRGVPGAYLRVVTEGTVRAGDLIEVSHRPDHDVTIALMFRALTTERSLLPRLAAARDALPPDLRAEVAALS
jgi:MOSC domain-containing protein YiiM